MLEGYDAIKDRFPDDCPPLDQVVYAAFHYTGWGRPDNYHILWKNEDGQWYEAEDFYCSCHGFVPFYAVAVTQEYVDTQIKHQRGNT